MLWKNMQNERKNIIYQLLFYVYIFLCKCARVYAVYFILCVFFSLSLFQFYLLDNPSTWMSLWRWLCLLIHRFNSCPLVAYTIPYCTISNNLYACVIFTKVSIKLLLRMRDARTPGRALTLTLMTQSLLQHMYTGFEIVHSLYTNINSHWVRMFVYVCIMCTELYDDANDKSMPYALNFY